MTKEEKQLNVRIKDGDQFFANEIGLNFTPTEIVLDFKCISNIHDIENHRALLLRHNPVILTPYHAKSFLEVLTKAVNDYEKRFGEIKKPKEIDKAEKIMQKQKDDNKSREKDNTNDDVTYFG
ncbi:MAG: DUF3467 domain-containing protein [Nanoarchaeota archaeon]